MLRLRRTLGFYLLTAAIVTTMSAHAATYYVATTGSDHNPGTEDQPWQTIAHAVDLMVAGDTTYVKAGTYYERFIRFSKSGTAALPIKLLNYPGHSPIIDFQDKVVTRRLLIEHGSGSNNAIAWITIEGFEIKNAWDGIKFYSGQDLTIRRNWLHDNIHQGILGVGALRILIDRNKINHNGDFARCAIEAWTCNQDHGIYAHGSSYTITNNLIYDNLGYGIQQNGSPTSFYSSSKHPSTSFAGAANWVVAHNTLAYQANRSGMVVWGSQCTNSKVYNNIFYENAVNSGSLPQGVAFTSATCSGVEIRNNYAYASASGSGGTSFLGNGAPDGMVQSGNIVNTSSPAFVNAGLTVPVSPNFTLTTRSPAIDVGLPIASIRTAFDGTPRPQGRAADIGAYEYTAGADVQSPSAPKSLRAD
jgi:hypothetical protein